MPKHARPQLVLLISDDSGVGRVGPAAWPSTSLVACSSTSEEEEEDVKQCVPPSSSSSQGVLCCPPGGPSAGIYDADDEETAGGFVVASRSTSSKPGRRWLPPHKRTNHVEHSAIVVSQKRREFCRHRRCPWGRCLEQAKRVEAQRQAVRQTVRARTGRDLPVWHPNCPRLFKLKYGLRSDVQRRNCIPLDLVDAYGGNLSQIAHVNTLPADLMHSPFGGILMYLPAKDLFGVCPRVCSLWNSYVLRVEQAVRRFPELRLRYGMAPSGVKMVTAVRRKERWQRARGSSSSRSSASSSSQPRSSSGRSASSCLPRLSPASAQPLADDRDPGDEDYSWGWEDRYDAHWGPTDYGVTW